MPKPGASGLRTSLTSYGDEAFSLFLRKAFIKAMGYSDDALERPIVGITNTFSGYNACHQTVPQLIEAVKRGVMQAGGLPIEFPTISLHESFAHPTSMLYRNLMAMDTEEMLTAQPMDAVVLIGGCDKTVPAQLMAAASANIPAAVVVTGPMMTGSYRGERLGACTDCRRLWGKHRGGELNAEAMEAISGRLAPTAGTCMVMGTASTMALMTEALGMMLPGGACIPAVQADRMRHAEETGRRAVAMIEDGLTPDRIMTPQAFTNALRVLLAIGGSTNALIHFTAVAGRLGIRMDLQALDRMSRETPVLVDLKPSGTQYMEDLQRAGGLTPILRELREVLHLDCLTISGRTLGEDIDSAAPDWDQNVVRSRSDPIHAEGGLAILNGNLAPLGAVIKQSGAGAPLQVHEGRALVFDSLEDMERRIDDPPLDVTAEDVLVLRNAGPKGAPGMPEAGYIPIPRKLAQQGVRDMVRISDARMSGTVFGTIVLHIAPEAALGGPLARIRTGDRIRLDVPGRRLDVLLDDEALAAREPAPPPEHGVSRGYKRLHHDHVLQADEGCDLDFLVRRPYRETAPV